MGRGDVADVGGMVVVNELTWDEGGGAHRDNIARNDERRRCRRLSLGSHITHSDMVPSIPIDVATRSLGDVALPCHPRCRGCG